MWVCGGGWSSKRRAGPLHIKLFARSKSALWSPPVTQFNIVKTFTAAGDSQSTRAAPNASAAPFSLWSFSHRRRSGRMLQRSLGNERTWSVPGLFFFPGAASTSCHREAGDGPARQIKRVRPPLWNGGLTLALNALNTVPWPGDRRVFIRRLIGYRTHGLSLSPLPPLPGLFQLELQRSYASR